MTPTTTTTHPPLASHPVTPSTHPSNPYNFTPQLLVAAQLPPKITPTHIFFFGYEGSDPHVDLQQWFPAPYGANSVEMVEFPTTEHYMMYHKALLMGDREVADRILGNAHPSAAKKLGREVRDFDGEAWKCEADRMLEEANWFKLSQGEELGAALLGTGDRVLIEANWVSFSFFVGPACAVQGSGCGLTQLELECRFCIGLSGSTVVSK